MGCNCGKKNEVFKAKLANNSAPPPTLPTQPPQPVQNLPSSRYLARMEKIKQRNERIRRRDIRMQRRIARAEALKLQNIPPVVP